MTQPNLIERMSRQLSDTDEVDYFAIMKFIASYTVVLFIFMYLVYKKLEKVYCYLCGYELNNSFKQDMEELFSRAKENKQPIRMPWASWP